MNRIAARLIAVSFRSFGSNAMVLPTYEGLDLGKKYTSGKECFPCQVTLGDILLFLKTEQELLGPAFDPENYLYFLPESDGPCRFGMYNKFQRIVLDSFPGLDKVKIVLFQDGGKPQETRGGFLTRNSLIDHPASDHVCKYGRITLVAVYSCSSCQAVAVGKDDRRF